MKMDGHAMDKCSLVFGLVCARLQGKQRDQIKQAGFKAKLRTEPQPQPHPPWSVSTAAVPETWQLDGLQLDLVGGLQP